MPSIIIQNAEERLSEIEEEALKNLRTLIDESGDPYVINNKLETTDSYLLKFLRCRKYDPVTAFTKRLILARKVKYPELFDKFYPSALYKAFDTRGGGVLKERDANGRHIFYLKASAWDTNILNADEVIQAGMMIGFELLERKETQLNGIVLIFDTRGFSFKMARQANPMLIQKYLNIILNASPVKIKALHILHAPVAFNIPLRIMKMFLPGKICNRIHTHGGNLESLHEFISPDILPDVFGGKLSEDKALDEDLANSLYSQEREDYYKSLISNCTKF